MTMAERTPTIFDRILDGDIPCHKIYEDEHVLAFLDINPLSNGHTLVIPKERKAHLHELSDESAAAVGRVLPRIARALMQATNTDAYNLLQNNGAEAHQEVMYVHFHLIPRQGERGLGIGWRPQTLEPADGQALLSRIHAALEAN